jgi:HEAT repeat protein
MPPLFSPSELGRLLTTALTVNDEVDTILTIAVKACQTERVPVRLVVSQVFEDWTPDSNYPLKKVCRAFARLDQLDALAPLLQHRSQAVRLAVIHAYYNFGVPADVRTLERLLTDQDPEIRVKVRDAIETIVDPEHTPRTRQAVAGVLTDDDLQMTRIMLGRPLESADIARVVHLLFSPSGPIRQLARQALQSTSHRDTLMNSLERAITSETSLSAEAVETLRHHDSDRAIALLIRVLADSDKRRGDGPGAALESLGPKAAPRLLEAFATDGNVRRRWGALVARVAGSAALPALLEAFESPYHAVRHSAADGLLTLRDPASVTPLISRLERANHEETVEILNVLGGLGLPAARQPVLQYVEHQDPHVRIAAIRALQGFNTPEATEMVVKAFHSPNWRIRKAAVDVIGSWDWHNREAVAVLTDAFHDPDTRVSGAAASSLNRLAHGASATVAASSSFDHLDHGATLEAHVERLAHALDHGDANERASATEDIARLRGLLAFHFAQLRVFSPEGERRWDQVTNRIKAVVDLSTYEPTARRWMRTAPPHATAPVATFSNTGEQRQQSDGPQPITDNVRFSVTCPVTVTLNQACVLDVWVHSPDDLETVLSWVRSDPRARSNIALRSKGPVAVTRGTTFTVKLDVASLGWSGEDTVSWTGEVGNASYSLVVPASASTGDHAGYAHILVAGVPIARVSFLVTVGSAQGTVDDVTSRQRRVNSAFASYATEDRNEVLARIQGMLSVVPDLDIFVDVMSLRSGERWEERLEQEILNRDVLYLFWSGAARRSPWVDREWRIALRTKGLDGIDPVPLDPPHVAPPPTELASLHFNEWTLHFRHPGTSSTANPT